MTPAVSVTPPIPTVARLVMENSRAEAACGKTSDLTRRLAAGEEEAFREFHAAYFDRLLRYLLVVTRGDEDAARDALQETFVRVVRHAKRFEQEDAFWSWLTVLARSAAVDAGRKRQRYWRLIANYALSWMAPAPVSANEDEVDETLQALLQLGLEKLATDDRTLIESKYLRGATTREIAVQLSLTERAVESRLRRARQHLRENVLKGLKNEQAD